MTSVGVPATARARADAGPERGPAASPWLPRAPCTPESCLADPGQAVAGVRRAVRWFTAATVLLVGIVLSPPARRCSAARRDRLTARWCRAVVLAFGVRIEVIGGEGDGPVRVPGGALVVANHVSWLDVPLLASVRPGRNLAKSEVGAYPVLGPLAARGATIFLERDRLRALPGTVAEMAGALRAGSTVVAFPEGSTWCGGVYGRFRNAVFQAALDAGAPVRPVRIRYRLRTPAGTRTASAAAFVGDDTLLASLRRVVAARGLVAEVTVLPPLPLAARRDRGALARAAQVAVAGEEAAGGVPAGEAGPYGIHAPLHTSPTAATGGGSAVPLARTPPDPDEGRNAVLRS
ncbi:lysophospholipid acyltransferase family protein [Streptomyces sp. NPDC048639]|uniref:lysophospholipid acyltransferase family protein n=1 Tax=Streptomyces sp. NPDC048639 TaxID=3365581 RepID=UPI003719F7AA